MNNSLITQEWRSLLLSHYGSQNYRHGIVPQSGITPRGPWDGTPRWDFHEDTLEFRGARPSRHTDLGRRFPRGAQSCSTLAPSALSNPDTRSSSGFSSAAFEDGTLQGKYGRPRCHSARGAGSDSSSHQGYQARYSKSPSAYSARSSSGHPSQHGIPRGQPRSARSGSSGACSSARGERPKTAPSRSSSSHGTACTQSKALKPRTGTGSYPAHWRRPTSTEPYSHKRPISARAAAHQPPNSVCDNRPWHVPILTPFFKEQLKPHPRWKFTCGDSDRPSQVAGSECLAVTPRLAAKSVPGTHSGYARKEHGGYYRLPNYMC